MPKRPCPFDCDLSPQMKVHVGQKEVDNGVLKDSRMKNVHEKTMSLLMNGTKELSKRLNRSTDLNLTEPPSTKLPIDTKSKPQQIMKQMFLNNKLQLEANGADVKNIPVGLCGCCRVIDPLESSNCYYCEKILCSTCLIECAKCSESFCSNCSMVVYDGGEHNVCLNCYH